MKSAVTAALCFSLVACKREPPPAPDPDPVSFAPSVAPVAAIDASVAAARCTLLPDSRLPAMSASPRIFGSALVVNARVLVGTTGAGTGGAQATVASVDARDTWVIAQGPEVVADAPPPEPLAAGDTLYAVATVHARTDAGASRTIELVKLGVDAKVAPVASWAQGAAESFAFDAAIASDGSRAALVWDADSGITLATATLANGAPAASAPRTLSPDGADVDSPRVMPRADGFWIAWIERKAEGDASAPRVEGPAEDRAFAWVDLALLDASGAPVGALRRVTSLTGHVSSFDLATRPTGDLDVFARDDTQAREASGGRILHVVVHRPSAGGVAADPHVDDAMVLVPDAVGRGSIDVLTTEGGDAWLTFFDHDDRARLAPLTLDRVLAAPSSEEPALDGARLLALVAVGPPARFVAALPAAAAAPIRDFACAR